MEKIHRFVQKLLVATVALCFSFVVIYTPQPINQIQKTEAFFGADAKEVTQWINRGLLLSINTFQSIVSFATNHLYLKEIVLDPIAWFTRKVLIAEITNSMIAWINSGFKGAPMFVQDLERYMLTISDRIYGEFIHRVGAAAFVCQPFRANVQVAFAQAYQQARVHALPIHTVPTCNLTGPITNLGNFINGSFNDGGWDAWYMLATQSDSYTPYGSLLAVQDEGVQQIMNAEQAETRLLEFSDGFISNKICSQVISAFGVSRQKCDISTPGQVISEALNFQLTAGVESLIAADEIGELVGDLVGRIGGQALMGIGGLLGLSSGTGYTDYTTYGGTPAVDQMIVDQEATRNDPAEGVATNVADDVSRTLQREYDYQAVATTYRDVFIAMNDPRFTNEANNIDNTLLNPVTGEIPNAVSDIQQLINDFQTGNKTMAQAYTEFKRLTSLHTPSEIEKNEDRWFSLFYEAFAIYDNVANKYDNEKRIVYTYKGKLEATNRYPAEVAEAQKILDSFSSLRQILTDYSTNRATDPLAGSKAVQTFLNIQGTLYTEADVEAKISQWIDLVGPLQ